MHQSLIGVYNEDAKENRAFCTFTRHFQSLGLPVPALLAEDLDNNIYLLDDLGDTMLLNILQEQGDFTPIVREAYQKHCLNYLVFRLKELKVSIIRCVIHGRLSIANR